MLLKRAPAKAHRRALPVCCTGGGPSDGKLDVGTASGPSRPGAFEDPWLPEEALSQKDLYLGMQPTYSLADLGSSSVRTLLTLGLVLLYKARQMGSSRNLIHSHCLGSNHHLILVTPSHEAFPPIIKANEE